MLEIIKWLYEVKVAFLIKFYQIKDDGRLAGKNTRYYISLKENNELKSLFLLFDGATGYRDYLEWDSKDIKYSSCLWYKKQYSNISDIREINFLEFRKIRNTLLKMQA